MYLPGANQAGTGYTSHKIQRKKKPRNSNKHATYPYKQGVHMEV